MISFVGAGPGALDLVTVRATQRLGAADVVIWASSLVPEALLEYCRDDVALFDSATMTLEEILAVYARYDGAAIVRLHSGDPTLYSAIGEQIEWCESHGREFEVVPGVSSLSATAAALGRELTVPGVAQSVVLTRLAHRTARSVPENESVSSLAASGATMALFLSAARPDELQAELLAPPSRYDVDTPVAVGYRVSWPDERFATGTLGALAELIRSLDVTTTVLVLVGPALGDLSSRVPSHVYGANYAHRFRPAVG